MAGFSKEKRMFSHPSARSLFEHKITFFDGLIKKLLVESCIEFEVSLGWFCFYDFDHAIKDNSSEMLMCIIDVGTK